MDADDERELNAVISEEKAKVVLGDDYFRLPYEEWVEGLKNFVQTQRCEDCGSAYNMDEPEEEMWGWFVEVDEIGNIHSTGEIEELEVVEFFCEACLQMSTEEREQNHPKTWGMLIFRRNPTGTFPFDEET
jgi:hypothetical protein